MNRISKITVQKQRTERYNIFFESPKGEEYAFSVDEAVLIKYGLKKGMELDELVLGEVQYQDEIRKAYNSAVQYLARMMRTEKEVRNFLNEKAFGDFVIQEVIRKLLEQQFLQDREYAFAYVRTQMNASHKGVELIKRELREKGVEPSLVEEALKEYPPEKQIQKAVHLLGKYKEKYARESSRLMKQKLEQALNRKGYPASIIQIAMEESMYPEGTDGELDAIRFQGEKVRRKFANLEGFAFKQKMGQSLYRKGFSRELIDKYLEEVEEERS